MSHGGDPSASEPAQRVGFVLDARRLILCKFKLLVRHKCFPGRTRIVLHCLLPEHQHRPQARTTT